MIYKKNYCDYYFTKKSSSNGDYKWWTIVKYLLKCNNYAASKKDIVANCNLKSHTMLPAMKYMGILHYNTNSRIWQLTNEYVKNLLKS